MITKKKRLIIIDGNALVHRAYYALPPLTNKKGELVNAVYGFFLVFLKVFKDFKPDYVVATFDLPAPTFRHKKFKAYKAQRPKTPKELSAQIPKTKQALRAFGIPIFEKEGYEADDLVGTISSIMSQKQHSLKTETIIVSGDLDTLQLVDSNTKVYTLRKGVKDSIIYDEAQVKERYGFDPIYLPDYKGLRGDPSDNIPGVPGIGKKTAAKLIQRFNTLESLYQYIEQIEGSSKTKSEKEKEFPVSAQFLAKLKRYKDQAFFSKMLAQIRKDVPIDFNLQRCAWREYDKEKVTQVFKEFGFLSLIKRLSQVAPVSPQDNKDVPLGENLKLW